MRIIRILSDAWKSVAQTAPIHSTNASPTPPMNASPSSTARIETMGVVGTGAMGRGIAQIAACAGLAVNLFDSNPPAVAARQYLNDTFAKLADKGKMSAADADAALARMKPCNALQDLVNCDIVVEAAVE